MGRHEVISHIKRVPHLPPLALASETPMSPHVAVGHGGMWAQNLEQLLLVPHADGGKCGNFSLPFGLSLLPDKPSVPLAPRVPPVSLWRRVHTDIPFTTSRLRVHSPFVRFHSATDARWKLGSHRGKRERVAEKPGRRRGSSRVRPEL